MMRIKALLIPRSCPNETPFVSLQITTELVAGEWNGLTFELPYVNTRIDAAKYALSLREAAQVLEDFALEGLPVMEAPSRGYVSNLHPTMREIVEDIYAKPCKIDLEA